MRIESTSFVITLAFLLVAFARSARADEAAGAARRQRAMDFHLRAQQPSGVLLPMYVYPGNIHRNAAYNHVIGLKRKYETVPMWVIVNPASGPGEKVDANYTK